MPKSGRPTPSRFFQASSRTWGFAASSALTKTSSARAMCHMSQASELRSSRGRTRICSSVRPAKVRSAADILLPPTAAECIAACWSRNRSRASMSSSPVSRLDALSCPPRSTGGPRCPAARKELIMPRIAPVTGKSDVPAEHHAVVDQVVKIFGGVRGPFSMLLHSPKLAERVLPLVSFFRDDSVVDARLRSVAILAAVREREAAYVWAAQVGAARRNGVSDEIIDLLRAKGDAGKLPPEERDIVNYTRQLMRTNRVDQAAFDALRKRHNEQWMVELTAAANYFALLSGVVNAFEVAAPPDGDKLPA